MDHGSVLRDRQVLPVGAEAPLAVCADRLGRIDVISAGYPCQPFSSAARGRNNARDLWPETLRIIRDLRPAWVVLENVAGYRLGHIERSCSDLEAIAYAVWPFDIAVPLRKHVRRRIWVVAHDDSEGKPQQPVDEKVAGLHEALARWRSEPEPVGMDDGLPHRAHRMRALGNGIETYIAELIFSAIAR